MRKLILLSGSNKDQVVIFSLFLITLLSIVILFPNKATFKYDFFKGKPWMHETLIAPFNFSILKTDAEIHEEKKIIKEQHLPFFKYDFSIYEKKATEFIVQFENKWSKNKKIRKDEKFTFFNLIKQRKIDNKTRKYTLANYALEQLHILYESGIIQLHADYEWKEEDLVVLVEKDGIAQQMNINNCYSISQASNYLSNISKLSQEEYDFLIPILSNCLEHNVIYNELESQKILQSELSAINLYKGLIQKGQIIITQGEIVSEANYQELISYRNEYEGQIGSISSSITTFFGQIFLVAISLLILFLFIKQFRIDILEEKNKLILVLFQIILMVTISSFIIRFNINYLYIIPFCILPIVLKAFFDNRIALFTHLISILIVGFIAPNSFEFIFLQLMAGIISILTVVKMYKRAQLFVSVAKIIIIYFIIYISLSMMYEGNINELRWDNLIYFLASGLLTLFAYPMIFSFERIFNLVSDISLLELADTNNPLLRKLSEEAPGTFQHSLQVANLSEEAIIEIGGNSLLVRAGAIYHDIGKIKNPMYFIENQNSGINPHSNLDFEESAQLIINHVSEGVSLAIENKLPNQLIDFIRTHHGTSTVEYFYKKFLKNFPEEEINETQFIYPGPKPFSKETAVLMMADAVEAATRSLKNPTSSNINILVEEIIDKQMHQGQFMEADITFKQITSIKNIFKRKLTNIHHSRVEY